MPTNIESLNNSLYRMLSKYKPKSLDASGDVTPIPDEADVIKFTFTKDGEDYGTVYASIDEDRTLTVYFDDDVGNSPEDKTPGLDYDDTWSGLLHQLSAFRMTKGLKRFDTKNRDQVNDDMARRKHMRNKDKIAEGYYPMGKKASYSDAIPTVKIVIEHSRVIEEGEQRYRNINKIFLENQLGERYLLDTKKPGIARVYARHIAEGGKVNDDRWNHVHSLCEEYQKMAGFVRATRNGQFNESAQSLVNEGIAHYASLRESLSRMTGKRGYNAYFESWTPALMETEGDETNLNELFVQETLDPRIESVMPILSRIHKKVSESVIDKEMNKLAEWADSLTEEESIKSNNPVGIPEDDNSTESFGGFAESEGGIDAILAQHPKAVEIFRKGGDMDYDLESDLWDYYFNQGDIKNYDADASEYIGQKLADHLGIDESALQAYLGDKKYGKDGMDKLRDAGRKHVGKEKMQKIRAQFSKKEEEVDEGLDANQKRVGQLGPTEKVGKRGAVGKLVGANENFINTADQAVVSEEDAMAEGILDSIKNMFKPKDPTPVTPVTSVDIVTGYKTDPEFKAQIDQIAKQQGMTPQALIAHIKQGLDSGADVIGVGEGSHTQHDSDLNPNDYERKQTDWSVDPIAAGTDRIHDKIKSMLGRLKKPASSPLDKSQTDIGSVLEAALPWEDNDEEDKDDKKPKDTKGSDGSEHGGHSRAKHLAKNAIPKDEKEEVKEGQDDLARILQIMNHRR